MNLMQMSIKSRGIRVAMLEQAWLIDLHILDVQEWFNDHDMGIRPAVVARYYAILDRRDFRDRLDSVCGQFP